MQEELKAIKQLQSGDIGGLEVLVRQHQLEAIRAVYLITQDRAQAEDIVQAAFIRVYERIGQFDSSRPFRAWFLKSVINDALKVVTRRKDHQPIENVDTGEQHSGLPIQADDPATLIEHAQTSEEVWTILSDLPPEQRATIVMRYYLDFSQAEIADELKIPLGTVKWRLHAARRSLKTALAPLWNTYKTKEG